jgi:tetraacyldisaccharide 4'-kinase
MKRPEEIWYGRSPVVWLLLPFAGVFRVLVGIRRWAYREGWLRVHRLSVPVIVVGNLTTGGTGKTPVTAWLVEICRGAGFRPGIVSRGYGGKPSSEPRLVSPVDDAVEVGDEPLLLRRQTGVPVCVDVDRVAAAQRLVAEGVNLIIADDGLQPEPRSGRHFYDIHELLGNERVLGLLEDRDQTLAVIDSIDVAATAMP